MPKGKPALGKRFAHWVTAHPWLKLISLLLAIMVWLYARGEIAKFKY